MTKGIKTVRAFDEKYYKFGDAYQLISKSTGNVTNAILLYCENSRLIFSYVGCAATSNNREAKTMYIHLYDLESTDIIKLVPETEIAVPIE